MFVLYHPRLWRSRLFWPHSIWIMNNGWSSPSVSRWMVPGTVDND